MKADKELAKLRHQIHIQGDIVSLKDMVDRAASVYGDRPAFVEKNKNEVITHSSKEICRKIYALGTKFIDMGLNGQHFAILGENSYNWILSFFAVTCGAGVAVPLDKELPDEELIGLMKKADVEVLICTKTYYKTAKKFLEDVPDAKCVVTMNNEYNDDNFYFIEDLVEKGQKLIDSGDTRYTDDQLDTDAMCAIVFTSGTTGANKGVMISHRNFANTIDGVIDTIDNAESSLSILPMNHVYELTCNIMTSFYMNAVVYINDKLSNFLVNLNQFHPDAMCAVPLVIELIYKGIWDGIEKKGGTKLMKKMLNLSNKLYAKGIDVRKVFFKPIAKNFGGKFPTFVCGGAPGRTEYIKCLGDFGFTIYQGYGLTEAAPTVSLNLDAHNHPESSGYVFPKAELIIHEPDEDGIGEIWIRGANITKGYYKDEKATKDSFSEDGWFMTGDYGRQKPDGELFVVGRKKTLIILDNGKNVFPEDIETSVMENIDYIQEVSAVEKMHTILGRDEKIIATAVYIKPELFPDMTKEQITEMVTKDISDKVNKKMPSYKKIQAVGVVFEELEKTSTLKIIRQKVVDDFDSYYHVNY